jgi:dihydroorotate dehydrogenase (NAD+) catalytic subunit
MAAHALALPSSTMPGAPENARATARPLSVDLAGIHLRSPAMLAAGTAGTLDEMGDVVDLSRVGAVVTKSITRLPRDGNATWRIMPSRAGLGMLNAIGLANVGVDAFVRDYAPQVARVPTVVVGSISGFSVEDFVAVAAAMDAIEAMPAVELNVSCPNVKKGCEFGADPALLAELVREVRAVLPRTRLFVKLSPIAMADIARIARAAIEPGGSPSGPNQRPGADALCVANTVPAMQIDVRTRKPSLSRGSGGLSGPSIHPIAVRLVHEAYVGVCRDSRTPIIGIGGVTTWEDAAEFILAGATAFEIGTALFADPRTPVTIAAKLTQWVRDQGCASITELVGAVAMPGA